MKLFRIREAKLLDGYLVQLILTDGRAVERDLQPLFVGPVFDEIRNDGSKLTGMRVDGGTLIWPDGAGLCPDVLIWGGLPPADAAAA